MIVIYIGEHEGHEEGYGMKLIIRDKYFNPVYVCLLILSLFLLSTACYAENKVLSVTITDWLNDKNAALSITFDDGTQDQILYGIPLLKQYQLNATFYLPTSQIKNWDTWRKAFMAGNEIGSHSALHKNLKQLPSDAMINELRTSYENITKEIRIQQCTTIAYPFGGIDPNIISKAKNYYVAGRLARKSTIIINEYSNIDLYQLKAFGLSDETTVKDLNQKLIELHQKKGWLIEAIHGIKHPSHTHKTGWRPVPYSILKQHFKDIEQAKDTLWIAPVNVIASYMRQKKDVVLELTKIDDAHYKILLSIKNIFPSCLSPLTIKLHITENALLHSVKHHNRTVPYKCKKGTCIFSITPDHSPVVLRVGGQVL